MSRHAALISCLALSLIAGHAAAQTAPQSTKWTLSTDGKSLQIKGDAATDDFDAACKAGAETVNNIQFDFGNKTLDSFAPIAQLKNLKTFRSSSMEKARTAPFDVAPFAGLTELEDVDFYATHIKNVSALASLKKIKKLSFYSAAVDSLDCVKGMPDLQDLNLYGFEHTFPDYTPLLSLKKLRVLNIYMNKQATDPLLAPLAALTSLESISMSNGNTITTLAFLKGCKNMEIIDANWCRTLKDISACAGMDILESLTIQDTLVTDLSPLSNCIYLRRLDLARTKVADLKPLEKCLGLDYLDITATEVKDLSPILKLRKLKELRVSATVPQEQIDKLKDTLPKVRVTVQK